MLDGSIKILIFDKKKINLNIFILNIMMKYKLIDLSIRIVKNTLMSAFLFFLYLKKQIKIFEKKSSRFAESRVLT